MASQMTLTATLRLLASAEHPFGRPIPSAEIARPLSPASFNERGTLSGMRGGSAVCLLSLLTATSRFANAEGVDRPDSPSIRDSTKQAAADGAFSPLTMPAVVGDTNAFAWASSGYDSSRKGPLGEAAAEVRLWGPVALRGGAIYSNDTDRMRPTVGARVQVLRQVAHGVDGAVSVFYKAEGFTEAEGEIEAFVSLRHAFEHLTVTGNLVYGQDAEDNERDGEVRAALLLSRRSLTFGLDARVRSALGPQHGKATVAEPQFDAMGGPLAVATVGPLAFFAEAGPSAVKMPNLSTHVGFAALGGVGSAF